MNKVSLNKTLNYILKYNPKEFEIVLDEDGFVDIDILIMAIVKKESKYENVLTKKVILDIAQEMGKYEIENNSIRAI